jgi:hypothetical protein
MSNTELLLQEIKELPPDDTDKVLDFVAYLKHKACPAEESTAAGHKRAPGDLPSLAEIKKMAEERATMERATGYSSFNNLKGCMKDSPCFAGRDGMEIQQEMRSEWPD